MPPLAPQSEAIIRKLISGHPITSGKLTLGPLESSSKTLLQLLVEMTDTLSSLKGEEQARLLRQYFVAAHSANRQAARPEAPDNKSLPPLTRPDWRLVALRCCSVRGIAPPGEEFEFHFHKQPNLIYGPNGSGKSSLLGAIVWIISGRIVVDSPESTDEATLYALSTEHKQGAKLRDWPIIATLPTDADVKNAAPNCWGELHLEVPDGSHSLKFRRQHGMELQASFNNAPWESVSQLTALGITPLDMQLSVIAPTIFGRQSIDQAEDSRAILSLILGYDEVDQIGGLASTMSGNRTKLFNREKQALDAQRIEIKNNLQAIAQQLPETAPDRHSIIALAASEDLTSEIIVESEKSVRQASLDAETQLATTLGLDLKDGIAPAGLADQLAVAIARLEVGVEKSFPSFAVLRLATILKLSDDDDTALASLLQKFDNHVLQSRDAIRRRYEWWRTESAPRSNASLLLKAAQHFDPSANDCPVCDRDLGDLPVTKQLTELKDADQSLSLEVRTFFGDLKTSLEGDVPLLVSNIASTSISDRIMNDWDRIRSEICGKLLAPLANSTDTTVKDVLAGIRFPKLSDIDVLPGICDEPFRTEASKYCDALGRTHLALSMLQWSTQNWNQVRDDLHAAVTDPNSESASLLTRLNRGKIAADVVKPLNMAVKQLSAIKDQLAVIHGSQLQLDTLSDLAHPLDELKKLSKFAESEVQIAFESIKQQTIKNLHHLYPKTSTGLKAGNLKLGKGKDKTIEGLLTTSTFEVAGQYFANAGLQRGIALAFYFALLEQRSGGLGFVLMDDPILSLDEDHRERWSANLLKPKLLVIQFILATHQKQFLRHCKQDFEAGRIVELNPRDHERRLSWRPGDRLMRAEHFVNNGLWVEAGVQLRKYGEDVLISLDAYSPDILFDARNLTDSLNNYGKLAAPHPLASDNQKKIASKLQDLISTRVLNPSAHSMTEADITQPMVEDCLEHLKEKVDKVVLSELERLDVLRRRNFRTSVAGIVPVPFPNLTARVSWEDGASFPVVGSAAANSNPWSVEFGADSRNVFIDSGSAAQVVGDSLAPVALHGQWVLLAEEGADINDGDLVAAIDKNDARYLRRVWPDGQEWILQAINPVKPIPTLSVLRQEVGLRKIIGVIYHPAGTSNQSGSRTCEWLPNSSLDVQQLFGKCKVIDVIGDSLDPIARNRQRVLIDLPLTNVSHFGNGELAVVEFVDVDAGALIKSVYRTKDEWLLVSPNPVDRLPPIIVPKNDIRQMWELRGVLFESSSDA